MTSRSPFKLVIHEKVTLFLYPSATWPNAVRRLASQYSVNPVQVVVGSLDLTAVHSVTQRIEIIDEEEKRDRVSLMNLKLSISRILFHILFSSA